MLVMDGGTVGFFIFRHILLGIILSWRYAGDVIG